MERKSFSASFLRSFQVASGTVTTTTLGPSSEVLMNKNIKFYRQNMGLSDYYGSENDF